MPNKDFLEIDGSMGEGGGQILRAALSLSLGLGQAFRLTRIRAKRPKPGLKRQHLTCVRAAAELCGATVEGDELNASELSFAPGTLKPDTYRFAVGTGGSVTLVLQALVPPLLFGDAPSRITVTGGTHVPFAPPFEFLRDTLFPWLERLGPRLAITMQRIGYMEAGGGSVTVEIQPGPPQPLTDVAMGLLQGTSATLYGHNLPGTVLDREIATLLQDKYAGLGLLPKNIERREQSEAPCPATGAGNMVLLTLRHGAAGELSTVFAECGWRGRSAEVVAGQAAKRAVEFLRSAAPVEKHLADQLLVPMVLAGGGTFVTSPLTKHTETCLQVIAQFTGKQAEIGREQGRNLRLTLPGKEESC